jgi:hypothetical protein
MTYRHSLAAIAVLLGFALSGCQPVAGPLTVGSPAAAVPSPSSSELSDIIQAAVEDRNGTALDVPRAPHLGDAQSTAAYRAKRARDLPVVARSKAGSSTASRLWYMEEACRCPSSSSGNGLAVVLPCRPTIRRAGQTGTFLVAIRGGRGPAAAP